MSIHYSTTHSDPKVVSACYKISTVVVGFTFDLWVQA